MEVLSFALIGIMAGAAVLWRIPATECDQCEHCLAERRKAEHRLDGKEHCPICRQRA